ncbi:MAG: hypothetical protein L0H74_11120 [Brachybacterium sp.]|nr:hypothetical protein [Brachybacterium sp.]
MTDHRPDSRSLTHHRWVSGRGGRGLLPALAGAAFATALLAGCGTTGTEEPSADPDTDLAEQTTAADDGAETTEEESPAEDSDSDDGDDAEGEPGGENLFEGTWGFGHDAKTLDADELADLLEEEAESRGPEEMSLEVECGDGVDTGAGDYDAECIAYADEGVEHVWLVTVGPADSGLEVEVENAS